MINEIDSDSHCTIDFPEFLTMMAKKMNHTDYQEDIMETFRVLDKDGSGLLTVDVMRKIILNMGDNVTDAEVDEMLKDADIDESGKLNYVDFIKIVMSK